MDARGDELVEASVEFAKNGHGPEARGRPEERLRVDARALLPRGGARRDERGDAPRRRRLHHGRGHRRDGRLDGRHAGDARRVRAGARAQHADLRDGDRRRRHRRRDGGDAPDRRDHVPGLHDALDGAAREPGGQAPLHVRRAAEGAADGPHAGRRGLVARRAARAAARGVVRPRPGAQGRLPLDARGRARPALVVDLRRQPRALLRAPHALPDQGRGARRDRADRARQGAHPPRGRGRDRGRHRPARARGARRRGGGREGRASPSRCSTRARCSRSTRRRSSAR